MYNPEHDYVPGEWERQDGVLLTWPRPDGDWAELWPQANEAFATLAAAICRFQPLIIVCAQAGQIADIEQLLLSRKVNRHRFRCFPIATDDTWSRDFGPIGCVRNGKPQLLNFRFNGWGNRYPSANDNAINNALQHSHAFAAPMSDIDFILEGGSIESDGNGALLTTGRCLLSERRNACDRDLIETQLKQLLPIESVLWLQSGELAGDDTDSHIDNLARFADSQTLLYLQCSDQDDEHRASLQAMETELRALKNREGKPYRLQAITMPRPIFSRIDSRRLPASYLNFLILNDAVLVPVYNDPADPAALAIIAGSFPGREVVGIDSRTFIEQNGGIHCLTMQLMADTLNPELFKHDENQE